VKLLEAKDCYLFEGYAGPKVIAGFTKANLTGILPGDLHIALAHLLKDFQVGYLKQIHSSIAHCIHEEGMYEGDGLFTSESNLAVTVRTADCLPLIFYSQQVGIVGVIHMGWRGAREGILSSLPYQLSSFRVIAGPGLRDCCYEVGNEFLTYKLLRPFIVLRGGRYYFDPIAFARSALVAQGLREENFCDIATCSACSDKHLFSYRKTNTPHRQLSFIMKL